MRLFQLDHSLSITPKNYGRINYVLEDDAGRLWVAESALVDWHLRPDQNEVREYMKNLTEVTSGRIYDILYGHKWKFVDPFSSKPWGSFSSPHSVITILSLGNITRV